MIAYTNVYSEFELEVKQSTYTETSSSAIADRSIALQGGLVMAKSGILELGDNVYGHNRSVFNHCDVIGQQSNRIR